jgi:hypothetical protein
MGRLKCACFAESSRRIADARKHQPETLPASTYVALGSGLATAPGTLAEVGSLVLGPPLKGT